MCALVWWLWLETLSSEVVCSNPSDGYNVNFHIYLL